MSLLFLRRAKPLFVSCARSHHHPSFLSPAFTNQLLRSFHGSRIMSESEKKILTEEELERKKKKEEKNKEKELKKQKALEKAKLAELKAKQAKDGTNVPKKSAKKSSKRDASEENPEDFVDPVTPLGERKKLSSQMAKQYSPAAVEKSWYAWWEKSDLFKADNKSSKPSFVMVLPPPNVTGALHIGHALTTAIEDTIIRWKRMSGYNALWVPGVDHAGIATQVVVEKNIMRERGMNRHDVGREEFIKEVWKWKNQSGGTILNQLRCLGASLDWSRECFTLDEQRSKAVNEAFVRLYKEGLIYRDIRLVNWDCVLRTAISDVEVEYIDIKERTLLKVPGYEKPVEFGLLTSFAYPLEGGLGEVVVATTRVETMLGDTAIAVHPDDARYKHLHGKFAVHPFNGRKLPIICDGILVDPNFGTGCVKITPAHDPNDCEVGKRHKLEFINIFTDDGKINTNGGSDFTGMPRFAAREAVVEALQKHGLYRGAKNNEMRLGLCSRTSDVIEPMIKPQWYVNCSMIGKEALDVAITDENKKLEFIPKQYTAEWRRWLENIRDWCISRQLWWGHRIPAWYATLEGDQLKEVGAYNDHWVVARTEEEARKEATQKFAGKKFELTQDPDVLDTWFSSGLAPLSFLGWPDESDDFKAFYPTSVLETGHDILFFWVARMVMMGMKLGSEVPFSKVYLHPMIRDAHGRKMSKSLGNVIDPLEVINGVTLEGLHKRLEEGNLDPRELVVAKEGQVKDFPNGIPECGTDALRFALVSYTAQGDNPMFASERAHAQHALWISLETGLRLLHPLMPFVTEELWQRLPSPKDTERKASIMICDYPTAIENWTNEKVESEMETVLATVKCMRALRAGLLEKQKNERLPAFALCENNLTSEMVKSHELEIRTLANLSSLEVKIYLQFLSYSIVSLPAFALCENNLTSEMVKSHELEIRTLANLSSLEVFIKGEHAAPPGSSVETINENLKVYLKVDGAINTEAEKEKIRNKLGELQKQKDKLQKMMSVSTYEEKVPANIREDNANKLAKILQEFDFFEKESARLAETSNSENQQMEQKK
ncbi:PREDICTED: valine--tRNA ligase, mitochondrial 1-like [Camelina sativa]|uniref:valine--tRNA ligase n=1 Tax=Camelina sativa TaxID=90675 RepID=A0ABM1R5W6_CAMSA|nr:PREDICTED: valine--tRNA ligase, mitochondrial 1-like [Camelina sativa]